MGYPTIRSTGTGTGLEQRRDDQQPILTTSPVGPLTPPLARLPRSPRTSGYVSREEKVAQTDGFGSRLAVVQGRKLATGARFRPLLEIIFVS